MKSLICGSVAYDTIMAFEGQFGSHILKTELDNLNVAFLAPDMRREFGGCAGNIAYNLNMLGEKPTIMATVGKDYAPYAAHLRDLNISQDHIFILEDNYSAQAFITTDSNGNQITVFHPGAMNFAHLTDVGSVKNVSLGIISPDGREGMIKHAREFHENDVPFIFDPGQGLPMFNRDELEDFIKKASYLAVNEYEAKMLVEKLDTSLENVAENVDALIVTLGSKGSHIYFDSQRLTIPVVTANHPVDPTGCGDAYRAGLIFGINNGYDWQKTGFLASILGAIKVSSKGPQNHKFSLTDISVLLEKEFGKSL